MLPNIKHPTFEVTIPSTTQDDNSKSVVMRPMLVKEEKLLLMAKESGDSQDILAAVKQVVQNCIVTPDNKPFDVDTLALFDIDYLFVRLRSQSVSNKTTVVYQDNDDEKTYPFDIDLNTVEVKFPENINKNIKVTDKVGIVMKYPPASIYSDKGFAKLTGNDLFMKLIESSIDTVYDGSNVTNKFDPVQLSMWVDNLEVKVYNQIKEFFNDLPTLYYKIEYKNSNGKDRKIELTSLTDFFILS